MNRHKLLQVMASVTLVVLFLVGCGVPVATPTPVVIVVTATPQATPMPSALTPTPVPPAAAPTNTPVPFTPVPVPPMPTVQVSGEYPVVQLTTRLGVDTTVEVATIDSDNDVLNRVLRRQQGRQFPLRTAEGLYMVVPLRMFRQAYEREGVHIVTLANGQEFEGQLDFIFDDPDGRSYDLRTASKVVLISLPEDEYSIEPSEQEPAVLWQLHILKPVDLTYSVSNPRFAFQYYSSAGYIIGGCDRETESQSFYLKVGDEEILANLPDFEQIAFSELAEGETDVQIKVKAKSGIETVGTLVLKAEDSAGYHKGKNWFLVMDSADSEIVIVLRNPRCVLRKVSE